MRGLRVLLLGPPRLEFDGQALTRLMAPKQQALVFFLATEEGEQPRSRLASLLWGELGESAARANLRVALTHLRRWLPDVLEIDTHHVGWAAKAPVSVDWHLLRQALDGGEHWPLPQRTAAAAAWRGPFLDGFELPGCDEFDQWLAAARVRATRCAVELRHRLIRASDASGDADAAIDHARHLLDIDSADEVAHMVLMQRLAERGERTAALAQYGACRAALIEQLGARPSAACYALYTRIHADTPAPSALPEASAEAVTSPLIRSDPLIGRSAEAVLLEARLVSPACRWLTIIGAGGMGKTRLAQWGVERLASRFGAGAVWCSARERDGASFDADRVIVELQERCHRAADPTTATVLLVLDNAETLPNARDAIRHVLDRVRGVTVLATSRRRLGGGLEWLLELSSLSPARATELFIDRTTRLDPTFDAVDQADSIAHLCGLVGGVPLALEMAAKAAQVVGLPTLIERLARGAGLVDPDRTPGDRHASMDVVLADSWAVLPPEVQPAAVRLAMLPGAFEPVLAAVVEVGDEALDVLREHCWLTRDGTARLAMHPLQQDFLRRRPEAAAWRPVVRDQLARYLLAAGPVVGPWGDHTHKAGQEVPEVPVHDAALLVEAADQVIADWPPERLQAWIDAMVTRLVLADRSAEATELLARVVERPALPGWQLTGWMLRRAELLNEAGRVHEALPVYLQAFERLGFGRLDAATSLGWRWLSALSVCLTQHDWPPGEPGRRGYTHLVVRSLIFGGQMLSFTPAAAPMVRASTLAQWVAWRGADPDAVKGPRFATAYGCLLFGLPRLAAWFGRGFRQGRPVVACDPRLEAMVAEGNAVVQVGCGHWDGLLPVIDEVTRLWQRLGPPGRHEIECHSLGAKLAFYMGLLPSAEARFAQLTVLGRHRPGEAWRAWGPFGLVEVRLCLNREPPEALRPLLEQASYDMSEMEDIDSAYTLRRLGLTARVAWRCGDLDAVRETVLAGVAAATRVRYCGFWAHEGYAGLGESLLRLRGHERAVGGALPVLEAAWQSLQGPLRAHTRRFPPAIALWHQLQGIAAFERGHTAEARQHLHRAVRMAERQGLRVELARCCEWLASVEPEGGWSDRAARLWHDMGAVPPSGATR